MSGRLKTAASVGLIVVVILVLLITLWPTPVDTERAGPVQDLLDTLHRFGLPRWFAYRELEFTANVVMFLPLGVFAGLLIPRRRIWVAALALPTLSIAVECAQLLFLPERYPTVSDVIANSVGAWIGLGLAQVGWTPTRASTQASSSR